MFTVALYKILQTSLHNNDKQRFMLTSGATVKVLFFFTTLAEKYSISSKISSDKFLLYFCQELKINIGKYSA